ncbi:MAG TPA: hypothetical protein VF044_04910 [Actinomycetota bacterium]
MGWLILILILLAAAFGVLGAVLKAAAFLVLTVLLTIAVLGTIGWYVVKHQARRLTGELDQRIADQRVERYRRDDGPLPPARDDRY